MDCRLVLYGFLGCGKTTLINHLLREIFPEQHVVVIENESGRESVDGAFLRGRAAEVVDLKAGCVCCTLRSELAEAVGHIERTMAPDVLILEPSGISALEDLLRIPGFTPDAVVTLVDVTRFDLLMRLNREFYVRQFRLSPVLLLTKTELVSEAVVDRVRGELEGINPCGCVVGDYRSLDRKWWRETLPQRCAGYKTYLLQATSGAQAFFCETFAVGKPVAVGRLRSLLVQLELEGRMPVRVKGLVDTPEGGAKVDAVGVYVEAVPVELETARDRFLSFWWAEPADREALCERVRMLIKACLYG